MEWISINWIMILTIVIVIANVISGYKKGFVKEFINCISLIMLSFLIVLLSSVLKNYTDKQFVQMLTAVIMVLVLVFGYKLVKMALGGIKILASLPVISVVNKLLGGVFGIVETMIVIWFFFSLIGMFDLGAIEEFVYTYICKSEMLTYIYEHNLLMILGEKIMGSDFQSYATDLILEQSPDVMEIIMKQ